MQSKETEVQFLRDLIMLLRDGAAEAKRDATKSDDLFQKGRQQAYYEVLSLILQQAKAFSLDLEAIALNDFDPDREIF